MTTQTNKDITLIKPDYSARAKAMKQIAKLQEETAAKIKRYDEEIAKVNDQITLTLKKKAKAMEEIDSEKMTEYTIKISSLENTRRELEEGKENAAAGKIPAETIKPLIDDVKTEAMNTLTKMDQDLRDIMAKAEAKEIEIMKAIKGCNETLSYLSSMTNGTESRGLAASSYASVFGLASEIRGRRQMEAMKGEL